MADNDPKRSKRTITITMFQEDADRLCEIERRMKGYSRRSALARLALSQGLAKLLEVTPDLTVKREPAETFGGQIASDLAHIQKISEANLLAAIADGHLVPIEPEPEPNPEPEEGFEPPEHHPEDPPTPGAEEPEPDALESDVQAMLDAIDDG